MPQNLGSVARNILWQFGHQGLLILNAVFVGAIVARHLGPESTGMVANAIALVAMLAPIVTLNSDNAFVRDYVQKPESRSASFWSLIVCRSLLAGACVFTLLLALFTRLIPVSSTTEQFVLAVTIVNLLLQPWNLAKAVLDAEMISKFWTWYLNSTLVSIALLKIWMVSTRFTVEYFAALTTLELAINTFGIVIITYFKRLLPKPTFPKLEVIYEVIRENLPLAASGICVAIYVNIDISMLRYLTTSAEVGIYSVACKMSSVWYFIPMIASASFLPSLSRLHAEDIEKYWVALNRYFELIAALATACVVISLVCFPYVIPMLYGPKFDRSVNMFFIHIFSSPFAFLGVARVTHLSIEKNYRFLLFATLSGVILNIALNWLLIPYWGGFGSAFATLLSYAFSSYATSFASPSLRKIAAIQTRSLVRSPLNIVQMLLRFIKNQK